MPSNEYTNIELLRHRRRELDAELAQRRVLQLATEQDESPPGRPDEDVSILGRLRRSRRNPGSSRELAN
jgi:hypothetical protein